MTVLLVVITFTVFILADLVLNRKKVAIPEAALATQRPKALRDAVEGIAMPATLRYHPGHTWLERERKNVMRVGVDAFAAIITSGIDAIELPQPGHWVRQGQKIITLRRGSEAYEMVSPVEGEVTAINAEAIAHPERLKEDPYGAGWLLRVFAPDEEGPNRNLLPSSLLRPWMRQSLDRLFALQPQLAGATAADGGLPVENVHAALENVPAERISREFFLQ